jgi:hypothetical protein
MCGYATPFSRRLWRPRPRSKSAYYLKVRLHAAILSCTIRILAYVIEYTRKMIAFKINEEKLWRQQ